MTTFPLATLVQRARTGDHEAFTALYLQFESPIRRYLSRRLRDPEATADMAQTVWEKAWRKLPETRPDTGKDIQAWLFRIANNTANDAHDKAKRLQWVPWETYLAVPHPTQVAPHDPEHEVVRAELVTEVRCVLARLKPQYRRILLVHAYFGGRGTGYDEIGRHLDLSATAAKSLLYRAKAAYREVVAGTRRPYRAPTPQRSPGFSARWPLGRLGCVRMCPTGRTKPYRASVGNHSLGYFVTEAEARAAIDAYRRTLVEAQP